MRPFLLVSACLVFPAIALIAADPLDAGFHTHFASDISRLLADFGLTNASPLDVRRYWFASIFIGGPLLAAIVAGVPAFAQAGRGRLAPIALSLGAAVMTVLGIVRSFD